MRLFVMKAVLANSVQESFLATSTGPVLSSTVPTLSFPAVMRKRNPACLEKAAAHPPVCLYTVKYLHGITMQFVHVCVCYAKHNFPLASLGNQGISFKLS